MCYGTALQSKLIYRVFQNDTAVCLKLFAPQTVTYNNNVNDQQNMLMGMWNRNGKGNHITVFIFYNELFW